MAKTLVLILVFCSTFALVQALYVLLVLARGEKRPAQGRPSLNARRYFALERLRRERAPGAPGRDYCGFRRLVIQSGISANPVRMALYYSCASIVGMLGAALLLDHFAMQALGGAIAGLAFVYLYFVAARRARLAMFSEQLPEAIELMVAGLRAGYPVSRSLALVAREMPDPISAEFAIASDEINGGANLQQAMDALFARVGHPALRFLAVALSLQTSATVSLPGVLSNLSSVIRQRYKQRRPAPAFMAEGRYLAFVLSAILLVFLGLLYLLAADFGEVWKSLTAPRALGLGAFMLLIGNFVIYRILKRKD